ncbi:jg18564 [Pararge aegeria aegeria]|uniref:Jg18564 protein n=1 Tax=Pararge aegeria aegeria TaxID=348720 RepID=A0A8S4QE69_9NEOP|nr:jg18564 [Pararge aegeria aegeria]
MLISAAKQHCRNAAFRSKRRSYRHMRPHSVGVMDTGHHFAECVPCVIREMSHASTSSEPSHRFAPRSGSRYGTRNVAREPSLDASKRPRCT